MTALELNSQSLSEGISENYLIKGTSVKGFQQYCDERIEEGLFKQLAKDTGLSQSGMILPSTWYSAPHYKTLTSIVADKLAIAPLELIGIFSPYMIERDLNGVYKLFFRIMNPKMVLSKAPKIDNAYNNYAQYSIKENSDGYHQGVLKCPEELSDWHLAFVKAGLTKMIELCNSQVISFDILKNNGDLANDLVISELNIRYI